MTSIVIAEDSARIALFLEKGLRASGFVTSVARSGEATLLAATDERCDLLILDLGLPDFDGHTVLRALRARGERMPVIILSARDGVDDTVRGLEAGADDYMTKPFRFEELLARIRLRLRDRHDPSSFVLRSGALELDLRSRCVWDGEHFVELSKREFAVLETMMRNAGQVLTREQLVSKAWGQDLALCSNVVDVYIRYLRRKVGPDSIETVRGLGYRFRGDVHEECSTSRSPRI